VRRLCLAWALLTACSDAREVAPPARDVPAALACVARHYGGTPRLVDDRWQLDLAGRRLLFDDGEVKSHEAWLARPDLEDTFRYRYPRGPDLRPADGDFDPGRSRHAGLLAATYGESEDEVRSALVPVDFLGHRIRVHEKVADRFRAVAGRLEPLRDRPDVGPYVRELGGTFHWRTIANTERLSPHAFGIAIDLNPARSAYFEWTPTWSGTYPMEIVEAFEKEGFIWGGRWAHFDTMHFEYRPELLDPSCYEGDRTQLDAGPGDDEGGGPP